VEKSLGKVSKYVLISITETWKYAVWVTSPVFHTFRKKENDEEILKCRLLCCRCHFQFTNDTKTFHKKRST
jgi:hypothetical protein